MVTKKKTTEKIETKTVDASGKTLGRVSTEVATLLIGKNKPSFERNKYSGSRVVVTNASKISINPNKLDEIYHTQYSGYPGGLRKISGTETVAKKGMKELVKLAIYHMLSGNKLRRVMMQNLTIED